MSDIKVIDKHLLRSSLTKTDDYFVLDLSLLSPECGLFTTENLGDELKFTCYSSPPKRISVPDDDIVVSVPYGRYESIQLRKLAHIIEQLSTLDELKYFRFYEIFDSKVGHYTNYKEYFLLETNERTDLNNSENGEYKLIDKLYEHNISEFNELLIPIIHGTVKKKIATMHGLLNHFTKNTKILIEQTMNKFDKKSSKINSNLQVIQNRILFQEARISRLNDFAWKILKQIGEEQIELSFSENETIDNEKDHLYIGNKMNIEVLTLKEAMEIRKSHGGSGLPEDFESPDELLQFDNNGGSQIKVLEKLDKIKKNIGIEKNKLDKNLPRNFHISKIEFDQTKTLHPAVTQLMKMKLGINLKNTKDTDKGLESNFGTKIYDPILEYKNNSFGGGKTLKSFIPTVFSYLGRPIPTLSHQDIPNIPKQKIIESIQHSMSTEVSKNEQWQKIGRPLEKKKMKEKIPEALKVKPTKHEVGAFNYSRDDVYNVLL
ncbi:hypothetical protein RS030_132080 [Cryptosporidium xiaoi]|uniref:Uncharacterized protein n=1 Tax=Cryptosporidium xiaoi TaxID=659607 RepID=A0AAV9Y1M8_9CRYT